MTLLSQAIAEALRSPDVQERLKASRLVPIGNSPLEAAAFMDSERQRWRAILDARTN